MIKTRSLRPYLPKILRLVFVLIFIGNSTAYAFTSQDFGCAEQGGVSGTCFYDPTSSSSSSACSGPSSSTSGTTNTTNLSSSGSNLDYAGNPILSPAELQAVKQNESTYQQAASAAGIPWEILAALHYRETGLALTNPSNGNGLYQITTKTYAAGAVSQQEFLQETQEAANFIKSSNPSLTATPDAASVKQAFFSYNGAAQAYVQQAESLGYPASQGYEGSPYVMNFADAKRDPTVNKAGWGQIDTNNGPLTYPADASQMGAFLVYSDLSGTTIGGSCTSVTCNTNTTQGTVGKTPAPASNEGAGLSTVRQNVICIAQQELSLWKSQSGYPTPSYSQSGYLKYSDGSTEEWCADFVSWVYNNAGYPFTGGYSGGWRISYVPNIQSLGEQNGNFHWHPVGSGYTPQSGDIAIHGSNHTNIYISPGVYIGGDQGQGPYPGGSIVSIDSSTSDITGYVSPD